MHSSGKIRVIGNSLSGRVRVVRFSPFGYRVVFGFVGYFVGSGGPFISDSSSDPMYTSNIDLSWIMKKKDRKLMNTWDVSSVLIGLVAGSSRLKPS